MPSDDLFLLSPSEALLLGLCLGEYEAKVNAKPNGGFRLIDTFELRLRAHFPSFGLREKVPLGNERLPDDINWVDGPREKIGFSGSVHDRAYFDVNGAIFYLKVHLPRRSFFDLLIVQMSRSLCLDPIDRIVYAVSGDVVLADDRPAINGFVTELVAKSQLSGLLEAGKLFGNLLSKIEGFQEYVLEVTDPDYEPQEYLIPPDDAPRSPDETDLSYLARSVGTIRPLSNEETAPCLTVDVTSIASHLRSSEIVNRCHYANTVLRTIHDLHFELRHVPTRFPILDAARLSMGDARRAQMCLWLAFGDVLGVLHDADTEFVQSDVESAAPRAFRLAPGETPDRVMNQIRRVERELAGVRDFDPYDVIARLNPLIEAIARRVWPRDFRSGTEVSLAGLFTSKIKSPRSTQLEKRLASIGRTLNGSYRNEVTHEFDAVQCSFDEARFFVSAIRAMVDLWRQITDD